MFVNVIIKKPTSTLLSAIHCAKGYKLGLLHLFLVKFCDSYPFLKMKRINCFNMKFVWSNMDKIFNSSLVIVIVNLFKIKLVKKKKMFSKWQWCDVNSFSSSKQWDCGNYCSVFGKSQYVTTALINPIFPLLKIYTKEKLRTQ